MIMVHYNTGDVGTYIQLALEHITQKHKSIPSNTSFVYDQPQTVTMY
jgi:hypothetical protein